MFKRLAAAFARRRKRLDHRKMEARTRFQPGCERLEERQMLASVPLALAHTYSTAVNTNLTITSGSSVNLLTGAFDVDGGSIASAVVGSPSNGSISSSGSDGSFVYTPDTNFVGLDSFTYKVNNGAEDSPLAEVRIAVGGVFGPRTNEDTSPSADPVVSGANVLAQELSLGQALVYNSNTSNPHPIIAVETSLKAGATVPNSIDVVLTFDGVAGSTVNYSNMSGLAAGDSLRFAIAADASALPTGRYDWSMAVTANYTGSTSTTVFSGHQVVVNRADSYFGNGWWLQGLDQLVVDGDGALWVRGNGETHWFADNGSGYDPAPGDLGFSSLVQYGNGTYGINDKYGNSWNFSSTGLHTSTIGRDGDMYIFSYGDHDSDSVSDELENIEEPFGRDFVLAYSGGLVSTFTDYASRATALSYSSGKLTGVTLADPDAGGPLAAPVWNYAYSTTGGLTDLLITQTDPLSAATGFIYGNPSRRLTQIDTPILGQDINFVSIEAAGLKSGSSNALVETVNPQGTFTNGASGTFAVRADNFGNYTEFGLSSGADTTHITRDANGQAVRTLQPDPGSGRPETRMGYSEAGDLLRVIQADGSDLNFTYDATYHNVLTAEDELGRITEWEYDIYGKEETRTGADGGVWSTDYTGTYYGLPASITSPDPDGAGAASAFVTSFTYTAYGQLDTLTNPDSTTVTYTHDSAGNLLSVEDEMGNTISYVWDALNRNTSITTEDPDGAGAQTAATTQFVFNGANLLTQMVDGLGNPTDYTYDARRRLIETEYADPDGAGSLGRPSVTRTLDGAGNETGRLEPFAAVSQTMVYDAYGHLTTKTWSSGTLGTRTEYWSYDVLGNLTSHTNYLSQTDTFAYDARSRLVTATGHSPGGMGSPPVTTYTYNAASQPLTVTNPMGAVTQYVYASSGWLEKIISPDPDGSAGPLYSPITQFGHDALGRQITQTDPLGRVSVRELDWRGNVLSFTRAVGTSDEVTTTSAYNDAGYLTSTTDELSRTTTLTLDNLYRRVGLTLPDPDAGGPLASPTYAWSFNKMNSVVSTTDPLNNVTTIGLDNLQRQITVTGADPDSGGPLSAPVTTYAWGANTQLASVTDALSHTTTLGYDDFGRNSTVTNHLGYVTTTTFNHLDQPLTIQTPDPDGAGGLSASTTTIGYDFLNRRSTITDAASGVTTFGYNLAGQLTSVRDPENNDTTYARDLLGRVTQEENELGHSRYFVYDAASNLTLKKDRNARLTAYSFDDLDRLTSENWLTGSTSLPSLAVATTTQGGPVNEVQRVGVTASMMVYGGTFTLSIGGQTTSGIAYNASAATVQTALEGLSSIGSGNIVVTKSQNTSATQEWTLTFQGALAAADQSQVTINSGGVSGMMSVSNIQATDTQGSATGNDEVQTVTLSNAAAGTFRLAFGNESTDDLAYNASASTVDSALESLPTIGSGNISVTGSAGGPYTVTFGGSLAGLDVAPLQGDASHATSGSIGRTIAYTFDDASQLTAVSDADSTYGYTYDAIGRILTESNSGTSGVPTVVLTNVYDAASNRTKLSSTIGGTADFQNDYSYDNLLRLDQIGQSGGNTVASKRIDFGYDDASRLTEIVRNYKPSGTWTEVATTAFSYDTIDRLTGIDHKQGGTSLFTPYSYTFDNANRITGITSQDGTVAYTYDATSQITGADYSFQTDEAFSWSANGNRTNTGYTTGTNNKMTSDGVYNYTYDNEGNLILRVKISDGSRREFTWDYRNRLTNITERATQYGAATMTVDYVYDTFDRRISKSFDADGAGGGSAVTSRYVFDGSDNPQPILQFDGSNNLTHRDLWALDQIFAEEDSSNAILWNLGDNLGTVRDVVNNSGTVQNHLTYDAFGKVTSETASTVDFLMGFAGMVRDEETGLSYAWHRYQQGGRWLSEDPIEILAGDPNYQRVVGNSPIDRRDPTGLADEAYIKAFWEFVRKSNLAAVVEGRPTLTVKQMTRLSNILDKMRSLGPLHKALVDKMLANSFIRQGALVPYATPGCIHIDLDQNLLGAEIFNEGGMITNPDDPMGKKIVIPKLPAEMPNTRDGDLDAAIIMAHHAGGAALKLTDYFDAAHLTVAQAQEIRKANGGLIPTFGGTPGGANGTLENELLAEIPRPPRKTFVHVPKSSQAATDKEEKQRLLDFYKDAALPPPVIK